MKYFLLIPILTVFILAGCAKENSITGPQSSQSLSKRAWIKINPSSSLSVENTNTYTVSQSVNGNKGGTVFLSGPSVSATLTIPQGAYNGNKVISFTVNTQTATIDFTPIKQLIGQDFNKNLSLDFTITGIDISGYTGSLSFAYLENSGNIVPIPSTTVTAQNGSLSVSDAQISHFSRYGWSTIDDPSI